MRPKSLREAMEADRQPAEGTRRQELIPGAAFGDEPREDRPVRAGGRTGSGREAFA